MSSCMNLQSSRHRPRTAFLRYGSGIMSSALGSQRGFSQAFILIVAALVFAPGTARAQFPGYGWGYGFPGYGYGYASPFGYGMPGYGYGMGYGPPGIGIYYGYPAAAAFGYGSPIATSPYLNPFFGLGLTPLGTHSYFTEMNLLGRGQLEASRRARARELQGYRGR